MALLAAMVSAFFQDFAFLANFRFLVFCFGNKEFVENILVTLTLLGVLSRTGVDPDPAPPCVFHISRRKRKRRKTVIKTCLFETLVI